MIKKTGEDNGILKRWIVFPRVVLTLLGALLVILMLVIGLNVGGLREEILWRISPPRIGFLAILPFENLSRDPEQEEFAYRTGMMITGQLQRIGAFRVIGPMSSMARYRKKAKPPAEIAQELNVAWIVQGGVLRSGDHVRISVNLVHAPTNRRIWEQAFERDLPDILNLHAQVAHAIALRTRIGLAPKEEARLTAKRRMVNRDAFDTYVRGLAAGDTAQGNAHLKRAIQIDPTHAEAYDVLAMRTYMRNMFPTLAPRDTYPAAKEAAQKAAGIDPTVSSAVRTLALAALEYDWDFVEAQKQFERNLDYHSSGPMARHYSAHFSLSMGRMEEARAHGLRALELSPFDPTLLACLSWHDIAMGDFLEAEKHALQALSLGAPDQLARLTLGWSYALRGRHDEAITEFQKAVVGWKGAVFPTAALGHAYAVAGKQDAALEVLNGLLERFKNKKEYVSPYEVAMVYAGLGDRDRAFEWLEKAYEDRSTFLVYFRMDPRIWNLRSDPRHQNLLGRMNFPADRRQ